MYCDRFREVGEGTSIPPGLYNLDEIKKWGKSMNWCPYYLIHRVINHQVLVDMWAKRMTGIARGGGCKW